MTAVADAGPLIALAKIGGLETLHRLHPEVFIPPAVHWETIEQGLARGEPDAAALSLCARQGKLLLASSRLPSFD